LRLCATDRPDEECVINKTIVYSNSHQVSNDVQTHPTITTVAVSTQTAITGDSPNLRFSLPQSRKESFPKVLTGNASISQLNKIGIAANAPNPLLIQRRESVEQIA
jgi:hypothetical protein